MIHQRKQLEHYLNTTGQAVSAIVPTRRGLEELMEGKLLFFSAKPGTTPRIMLLRNPALKPPPSEKVRKQVPYEGEWFRPIHTEGTNIAWYRVRF